MRRCPAFFPAALVCLALLAGCASRADRIEQALVAAGASPKLATCMAPRLGERLSDDQLRALASAAKRTGGGRGAGAIVAAVAGTGDPAIVDAVSAAALRCALR